MEFRDVVRRRRMVRSFDPDRCVPPDVRDRLLDHARRAPSAGFTQGVDFLVLESVADRERFWATTASDDADGWAARMRQAPLLVVVFSSEAAYRERYREPDKTGEDGRDRQGGWPVPYWHVDAGFAALLMLLTAVDEGLGGCFFGVPADRLDALRTAFAVPADQAPVGVVAVGHPRPGPRSPSLRRRRRVLAELVHVGRW